MRILEILNSSVFQPIGKLPYKQRVRGSIPCAPTNKDKGFRQLEPFFFFHLHTICTRNLYCIYLQTVLKECGGITNVNPEMHHLKLGVITGYD